MYLEALNPKGKIIFKKLCAFSDFYLAGGTALALQIGHRISVDFDFFSEIEIKSSLLSKIKQVFIDNEVVVSVNDSGELTVFIDGIKVTFLYYPFPLLLPLVVHENISLLSTKEIAATKLYTIGRRGSYKDYIDLYFILVGKHASLEEIIALAKKKYRSYFNERQSLEQLI